MKKQYIVTTIKLEAGLKDKLKVLAIKKGVKFQELIDEILTHAMKRIQNKTISENE